MKETALPFFKEKKSFAATFCAASNNELKTLDRGRGKGGMTANDLGSEVGFATFPTAIRRLGKKNFITDEHPPLERLFQERVFLTVHRIEFLLL